MSRNLNLAILVAIAMLTACGPTTFTRARMEYAPYSAGELRQEKDGVIVELKPGTQLPPSFVATVARCDQYGRILVDASGRPVMEELSLARPGQMWHEIAITNHTDHVIRMNGVVLRLFDPGGSQYEALTRGDLAAHLYRERPCSSTAQASHIFQSIKVFDRNIEVVPKTTSTFWVPFLPGSKAMTGVWKFSVYELPVRLDSAGRPTRTTEFHLRLVAKEVVETLRRENPLAPATVISASESSPTTGPAAPGAAKPQSSASTQPSKEVNQSGISTVPSMREAQQQLATLGYNPGPADGLAGSRTIAALKLFQKDNGLPVTGRLDTETAALLGQRGSQSANRPQSATTPKQPAQKELPPPREKKTVTDL